MLMPRFSIRWLLAVTAACAVLALVARAAIDGRFWAMGVIVAVGSLAATFVVYGLTFLPAWLASLMPTKPSARRSGSVVIEVPPTPALPTGQEDAPQ